MSYDNDVPYHSSYKPIVDYIDDKFETYLQEELKVKRSLHAYHDGRIHACLYFLAPTGHSWVTGVPWWTLLGLLSWYPIIVVLGE